MWHQQQLTLNAKRRGFHLISDDIAKALDDMPYVSCGLLHLQLLHTSASLTLNENADPTVRQDFEAWFNHAVAEDTPYFRHTYEGADVRVI
ncbi:YjbQ family protein [Shewanella algae]|uniref:YjbQ family protein n=1 Tax=Shewanella algae TaxID=38313 RepID=UPI000B8ABE57|nr:YjbQ family protein [Shewanella algae]HDS1197467.1 YjbQ family protein [Shewanella algae]